MRNIRGRLKKLEMVVYHRQQHRDNSDPSAPNEIFDWDLFFDTSEERAKERDDMLAKFGWNDESSLPDTIEEQLAAINPIVQPHAIKNPRQPTL
jgi:hypothetical protein